MSDIAFAALRAKGIMNPKGEPRRLLQEFRQLRAAQLACARELGMTPAARMAIRVDGTRAAFDMAREISAAAQPTPGDDQDDEPDPPDDAAVTEGLAQD